MSTMWWFSKGFSVSLELYTLLLSLSIPRSSSLFPPLPRSTRSLRDECSRRSFTSMIPSCCNSSLFLHCVSLSLSAHLLFHSSSTCPWNQKGKNTEKEWKKMFQILIQQREENKRWGKISKCGQFLKRRTEQRNLKNTRRRKTSEWWDGGRNKKSERDRRMNRQQPNTRQNDGD